MPDNNKLENGPSEEDKNFEAPEINKDETIDETIENQKEFELTPEIEKKILDMKYMIDHWHDPNEIINPRESFRYSGTYASEILNTKNILEDRPVYFQEISSINGQDTLKEIAIKGINQGSLGIMPFWFSSFGNRHPESLTATESNVRKSEIFTNNDYDKNIKQYKDTFDSFSARAKNVKSMIPKCFIIAGQTAEKISDVAREYRIKRGGSLVGKNMWHTAEIHHEDFRESMGLEKVKINPSGLILGIINTEKYKDEIKNKRLREINLAEESLNYMKNNDLSKMDKVAEPEKYDSPLTKDELEEIITKAKRDLKNLEDVSQTKSRQIEFASLIGNDINLPIFDLDGDLLWPKQMSYEEVKEYVAERDMKKNKEEEETDSSLHSE